MIKRYNIEKVQIEVKEYQVIEAPDKSIVLDFIALKNVYNEDLPYIVFTYQDYGPEHSYDDIPKKELKILMVNNFVDVEDINYIDYVRTVSINDKIFHIFIHNDAREDLNKAKKTIDDATKEIRGMLADFKI